MLCRSGFFPTYDVSLPVLRVIVQCISMSSFKARLLLAGVALLFWASTAETAQELRSASTEEEVAATTQPNQWATFGLNLLPPEAFTRRPDGTFTTVGRWVGSGPAGRQTSMLIVEFEKTATRSLEQYGKKLADISGGVVESSDIKIGGRPTLRLVGTKPMPSVGFVTEMGNTFYVVLALGIKTEDIPIKQAEVLSKSITFRRFADARTHLVLREQSLLVHEAFAIKPVASLRPIAGTPTPGVYSLAALDFTLDRSVMVVDFQVLPVPKSESMAVLQKKIQTGFKLADNCRWQECHETLEGLVTETFDSPEQNNNDKWAVALVRLDDQKIIMASFAYKDTDSKVIAAMHEASILSLKTIEPLGLK
jgi:hypothetical protein